MNVQDAGCGFRDHRLGLELPSFGGNPEVPVHGCGGATVGGLGALLPLADEIPNHTDRSTFVPLDNFLCCRGPIGPTSAANVRRIWKVKELVNSPIFVAPGDIYSILQVVQPWIATNPFRRAPVKRLDEGGWMRCPKMVCGHRRDWHDQQRSHQEQVNANPGETQKMYLRARGSHPLEIGWGFASLTTSPFRPAPQSAELAR